MIHFFAHFRLCVLEATQAYCYEEVRNYEKLYLTKALLNMAGGEDASPSGPAPGHHDRKCPIFLPKSSEEQKTVITSANVLYFTKFH